MLLEQVVVQVLIGLLIKNAPGLNGPGEFGVKLSSVSDVPSGAITKRSVFDQKIFLIDF